MTINNSIALDFQNIELGKHPTRSTYSFAEITISHTAIEADGRGRTTLSIKFGENGVKRTASLGKTVPADAQQAVARWQGLLDDLHVQFNNEGDHNTRSPQLLLRDNGSDPVLTHWYELDKDNEQAFTNAAATWLRRQKPRNFLDRVPGAEKAQVLAA